jgi:hypothetical protein
MQSLSLSDSDPISIAAPESISNSNEHTDLNIAPPEEVSQLANNLGRAKLSGLPPPPSLYADGWEAVQLPTAPQDEPLEKSQPRRSTRNSLKTATHSF